MWGKPISLAKESLKLFVKSLPEGSMFNVISFGSSFESIFASPVEYSNSNVNMALTVLQEFDANLGGTEIYAPLESAFKNPSSSLQKHVYLITDGCISDEQNVISLILTNNATHCVHTIGIGSGVSTSLIIEASAAGRGSHYFVDEKATGLNEIIINALCASMEPAYQILDRKLNLNGQPILQHPLFDAGGFLRHGSSFEYYGIIESEDVELKGSISIGIMNTKTKEKSLLDINLS